MNYQTSPQDWQPVQSYPTVLCFEFSLGHYRAMKGDRRFGRNFTPGVVQLGGTGSVVAFTSFQRLQSARLYQPALPDGQLVGCSEAAQALVIAHFNAGLVKNDPRITPPLRKQAQALIDTLSFS